MSLRTVFLLFVLILPSISSASNQTSELQNTIRRMITTGSYEGHDSKVIGASGDEAAIVMAAYIEDKDLTTPDIDMMLTILRQAFADPSQIAEVSNRNPEVARLLLRYFGLVTKDPALKLRITEAREYILKHAQDSSQKR
jgi:hypothetical protein